MHYCNDRFSYLERKVTIFARTVLRVDEPFDTAIRLTDNTQHYMHIISGVPHFYLHAIPRQLHRPRSRSLLLRSPVVVFPRKIPGKNKRSGSRKQRPPIHLALVWIDSIVCPWQDGWIDTSCCKKQFFIYLYIQCFIRNYLNIEWFGKCNVNTQYVVKFSEYLIRFVFNIQFLIRSVQMFEHFQVSIERRFRARVSNRIRLNLAHPRTWLCDGQIGLSNPNSELVQSSNASHNSWVVALDFSDRKHETFDPIFAHTFRHARNIIWPIFGTVNKATHITFANITEPFVARLDPGAKAKRPHIIHTIA